MSDPPIPKSERITTHGVVAMGATKIEVLRGRHLIGHVRRLTGRKVWECQPLGWDGWSGDFKRMRDAIAALSDATSTSRPTGDAR